MNYLDLKREVEKLLECEKINLKNRKNNINSNYDLAILDFKVIDNNEDVIDTLESILDKLEDLKERIIERNNRMGV